LQKSAKLPRVSVRLKLDWTLHYWYSQVWYYSSEDSHWNITQSEL